MNTLITVNPADWEVPFSKLSIRTRDRPGLLVEVVKVLKDINVNVISAEVRMKPVLFHFENDVVTVQIFHQKFSVYQQTESMCGAAKSHERTHPCSDSLHSSLR